MEKNPEGESCGSCVFSLEIGAKIKAPSGKEARLLKCRRFPPYAFPLQIQGGAKLATPDNPSGAQMGAMAVWPDVAEGQWCGEWASDEPEPGTVVEGVAKPG